MRYIKIILLLLVSNSLFGQAEILKVGGGLIGAGATSGQVLAWNGTTWAPATNTSESTKVGVFQNSGTTNGLSMNLDSIKLHSATISSPGGVSTTQQTFTSGAGTKIFNGTGTYQLQVDGTTDNTGAGILLTETSSSNVAFIRATSPDANSGFLRLGVRNATEFTDVIQAGILNDQRGVFEAGGLYEQVTEITTTPYTVVYGDRNIYLDGTDIVVNLQGIGGSAGQTKIGRVLYFFNDNSTSVTINRAGSDTINDATSLTLPANTGVTLLAVASGKWVTRD